MEGVKDVANNANFSLAFFFFMVSLCMLIHEQIHVYVYLHKKSSGHPVKVGIKFDNQIGYNTYLGVLQYVHLPF